MSACAGDAVAAVSLTLNGPATLSHLGPFNRGTVKNVENTTSGDGGDHLGGDALTT